MLDQWQVGWCLWISLLFFGLGVWCVVGVDYVQVVVGQCFVQGVVVFVVFDCWVVFEQMVEVGVVVVVEQQMVDVDFCGDVFLVQWFVFEQGQFMCCG